MRIARAQMLAFSLPLVAPLATAHGAITRRAGFLVVLEDETGRVGLGEATPLPDFGGETLAACRAALEGALSEIEGRSEPAWSGRADAPCARAAFELALADLAAKRASRSLAQWIRARAGLAGEPASRVYTQALVAGATPQAVAESARRALGRGFEVFKLKLLSADDRELERVAALREAVGTNARIRLDANEAWSPHEAERMLARLARHAIEYVEQPVARDDLDALAALDRDGPIAIAADEALIGAGLDRCLARRAARIFVLKPAVLGGIDATIALVRRAREAGIRIVFSNLIEGRVGREGALALAAALSQAKAADGADLEVHGLGTADLLARDLPVVEASEPGVGLGWSLQASSLASVAAAEGRREAIVFEERRVPYAELADAVVRTGDALAALGLAAGDLVAVLAPPSAAGVVLIHALFEERMVLLPLNTRLAEPELARALETTRPAALVVARSFDPALAARLAESAGCALIALDDREPLPRFDRAATTRATRGSSASAAGGRSTPEREALARIGAALVLMTSGTSGRAKAAILTHENLAASAQASQALLGGGSDDRWLLCMPLFHIAGISILVRAARAGACVVVEPRFDAGRVARALEAERISHVSLVATALEALLAEYGSRRAPPTLRVVLLGGGPAPQALVDRARAAGHPIAPTYGLTEAASQVATRPPSHPEGGLVPLPGVALRIVDEAGRPLPVGAEGGIEVQGPIVMHGYLDDPAATARALRDGWLATGDVGRLDESGTLVVLDRRTDLILSGGENVYPAEIESVIAGHPAVAEVGVVGVADAQFGARPRAFVVWRAGAARDAIALARWCRERLAGYKQPVEFVAVDALPRNASGKLLRRELSRLAPARPTRGA